MITTIGLFLYFLLVLLNAVFGSSLSPIWTGFAAGIVVLGLLFERLPGDWPRRPRP